MHCVWEDKDALNAGSCPVMNVKPVSHEGMEPAVDAMDTDVDVMEKGEETVLQDRLAALECPFRTEVSISDPRSLQKLTCWLEDVHIRRRPIPSRRPLRLTSFMNAITEYLDELEADEDVAFPSDDQSLVDSVLWLVDYALQLHFEDNSAEFNFPLDPWEGRCMPIISGAADDPQILELVHELLREIDVDPTMIGSADGMKIVADVIEERLSLPLDAKEDGGSVALEKIPLGFSTKDSELDRLCKVLRVLHVRELRKLQHQINGVISTMQAVTADPKTDSKLGRVGR